MAAADVIPMLSISTSLPPEPGTPPEKSKAKEALSPMARVESARPVKLITISSWRSVPVALCPTSAAVVPIAVMVPEPPATEPTEIPLPARTDNA